jgi:hypothetical protein
MEQAVQWITFEQSNETTYILAHGNVRRARQSQINVLGEKTLQAELSRFFLLFLLAVCVFGLALVPILLHQPNLQIFQSPFRRPFVSVIYSAVCIAGIVAVFYPGKCRMTFQKPNISLANNKPAGSVVELKGHHPNCREFSGNRITARGSVFCAACSGLLIGAIVAIVGIVLFSLGFFNLGWGSLWILVFGEVLMLIGLAQINMNCYVKLIVNALFVVGSSICLIVADMIGQSLLVDAYVLGITVFVLWFRILLSEWNNKRTCMKCGRCV